MDNISVTSNVGTIAKSKGIDRKEFIRLCVAGGFLQTDAAKKVFAGSTNIRLVTAANVAKILGVEIGDLFSIN